jgi:hypothetical protein
MSLVSGDEFFTRRSVRYRSSLTGLNIINNTILGFTKRKFSMRLGSEIVDKPFSATAQDRESMSFLRLRREDSSNNSNQ